MAGKPVTQIQPTANRGRKLRHVSLAPAPPGRHTSAGRDPRLVKIKRRRTLDDRLHCSPPSARPLHINRRPRASGTNESDRRARSTLPSSGVTPHARLKTGSRAPRQKDRRYGRRPDHPPFQDPGRSATALKELIATATPRELPPIARARLAYAPDATAPAEWDFRWSCDREAIRTLGRRLLDHESDGAGRSLGGTSQAICNGPSRPDGRCRSRTRVRAQAQLRAVAGPPAQRPRSARLQGHPKRGQRRREAGAQLRVQPVSGVMSRSVVSRLRPGAQISVALTAGGCRRGRAATRRGRAGARERRRRTRPARAALLEQPLEASGRDDDKCTCAFGFHLDRRATLRVAPDSGVATLPEFAASRFSPISPPADPVARLEAVRGGAGEPDRRA
jgi:hypothetical protein